MNADQLRTALADLADEVRPVDLHEGVLATSHQHRRRQAAATASATAVVLAVGGAAFAARPGGNDAPVGPLGKPGPSGTPAPGSLTEREIRQASAQVPAWPNADCPAGDQRLTEAGLYGPVVLTDVDRDGAGDAVVLLRCQAGAAAEHQVLALHRGPDGAVETLGQVAADGPGRGGGVIDELSSGTAGTIRLTWADPRAPTAADQRRAYDWTGSRFRQISGPSTVPPAAYDVRLLVDPVQLVREADGGWTGNLRFTVDNAGTTHLSAPRVTIDLPAGATMGSLTGAAADQPQTDKPGRVVLTLPRIVSGTRTLVSARLNYAGDVEPAGGAVSIRADGDPVPADNHVPFTVW